MHRRSRRGKGLGTLPNQATTNDKKLWQHSLEMFSCSFFFSVITHITVINNNTNDHEGAPGPLNNNQEGPGP